MAPRSKRQRTPVAVAPDYYEPTLDMLPKGPNFQFGFNDACFSDRVFRIEVIPDSVGDCTPNGNGEINKLKRGNVVQSYKTLHVSSLVLAESSPFFYKLFKNGMKESQETVVTLRINSSEEDTIFMDVLKFIYTKTLIATMTREVLDVLIVADKFEVTSCLSHCSELLKENMSLESALLCLKLPSIVPRLEVVQPLIVSAKEFLVARYSNLHKFEKEVMNLPLSAIEIVLAIPGPRVESEDYVFDFILEWATAHYLVCT